MIRLRTKTAGVLLSLGLMTPVWAQDDNINPPPAPEESAPEEPEGPSDNPSLPAGPNMKGAKKPDNPGSENIPDGQEMVSIDFPEPTEIKDIIRAVAIWTGKNVIMGKGIQGKVQLISPRKVTKEEAYQAFLSALNVAGYTTVETGKVIKILPTRNALKGNLHIYQGTSWAPRTDKLITQIVPLRYIDAKQVQQTLSQLVSTNSIIPYAPTNTLIISDTGYKVRRILQIIELLDVAGQQPKVALVPIRYGDAKSIAAKVQEVMQASEASKRGTAGRATTSGFKVFVDERSNSVVIFGPPRTIQDVKDLVKKFDFPVDDPANQAAIRVRFLDYADAKKIASTLSSLAQGNSANKARTPTSPLRTFGQTSPRTRLPGSPDEPSAVAELSDNVKITADESSNSLLITGSRAAYEAVNGIIRKLDRRRPQVYVEADILDVNLTNNFKFGTSTLLGAKSGNTVQAFGWQGATAAPLIVGSSAQAGTTSNESKLAIANALGKDFTIGVLSGKTFNIPGIGPVTPAGLISMIKEDGNTRVLSSPSLMTLNNEEAKIIVGNTIFYKTAVQGSVIGAGSVEKVEKEPADLTMALKPNISHSGNYITLKLDIEANEGTYDASTGTPKVNKRQTSQMITVKSGQTAVISGLVKRTENETFQKIPLLGDIPIIGWLFRNTTTTKTNASLMFFLTPYIVYGANDLAAIYEKKVADRDAMLTKAFGDDEDDEFMKALPSPDKGKYKATEDDVLEEREQDALKQQMREDRGLVKPATPPAGELPNPEADGRSDEAATVPFTPDGGADDGGGGPGIPPPIDNGDGGGAPPPPPPPEPMDIPEPIDP